MWVADYNNNNDDDDDIDDDVQFSYNVFMETLNNNYWIHLSHTYIAQVPIPGKHSLPDCLNLTYSI